MSAQSICQRTRLALPLAKAISLALLSSSAFGANRPVLNCGDGGAGSGSLRDIITNVAAPGDTVDLSQLPAACGMADSKITLGSEIVINQGYLTILGPSQGTVTISGGHNGRVFDQLGNGQLELTNLTITDGTYANPSGDAAGGCIFASSAFLTNSTVSACEVTASGVAEGGGIKTLGNLVLSRSNITGNHATSTTLHSLGGGASVDGTLNAKYSSVQDNVAQAPYGNPGQYADGGGLSIDGDAAIYNSSILANVATTLCGGIEMRSAGGGTLSIVDSTISDNVSTQSTSALWSHNPVQIYNSTIAFNTSNSLNAPAVTVGSSLTLQSSIIANNENNVGPADLAGFGSAFVTGANNIVMASTLSLPAGTSHEDPMLGTLQMNGGLTLTRSLLPGSPAIGQGNNMRSLVYDQRGWGHPRAIGAALAVDVGATQFDPIFVGDFEP